MTRKVHRGRKGDGWPRTARQPARVDPGSVLVLSGGKQALGVCPQHVRCGHVVCSIVWYCVEAA